MDVCNQCKHYDETNTYSGTGVCNLWDIYVEEGEAACNDYEASEDTK